MDDLFYLQDSRSYVGNDVLWWAINGNGYTTDMRLAQTYTKDEAQAQHSSRPSDIPWPKSYIDSRTRPSVDMQYIRRDEALAGTGIELITHKFVPKPKEPFRCSGCGKFMSQGQFWSGSCNSCGADSRP